MRKLIRKITTQKELRRITIIVFVILIAIISYIFLGVQKNIAKMQEAAEEVVTFFPEYPAITPVGKNPETIKRGEYLAKAGDCIACHTNTSNKGKAFAGGLAMPTPFGTIYTPNITPDKKTGIGNWSEEQFIKAMREGISPEGHYYYPAFPYLYFNRITTEDLKALKAYLDSVPAVEQPNLKNDMLFPFNWRFMQLGWRILFFYPENSGAYEADPHKTPQWNRGAYLVEGLGHCAMCHSPSYHIMSQDIPLGAPIRKYNLTGGKVQGFLAPNISEANLSKVPVNEIVEVFTKDRLIGGGNIEGPMLEANRDSLKYLSADDQLSIANYLKSVVSQSPPKPKGSAVGKALYETYCSACHTSGGGGAPKFGDAGDWEPVLKPGLDTVYQSAILGKGSMPAKGTCLSCSDDEIKQAVNYMVAAVQGKKVVVMTAPKKLTLDDGKKLYQANCSVCHETGFKKAPKPGDQAAWKPVIDAGFLKTYEKIMSSKQGHPAHGACPTCSDAELIAALKYMMTVSSGGKDYSLW